MADESVPNAGRQSPQAPRESILLAHSSDLHLASGNSPMLRINGELQRVDFPPLENDGLKTMLYEIAPEYKIKHFEETGDVDFGYEIPNISRFRANFFNAFNIADYQAPDSGISDGANFGKITSKLVAYNGREVQYGLRLVF